MKNKLLLMLIMTMALALCACGQSDTSNGDYYDASDTYNEEYESDDGGKLSDSELEDLALQTLYKQLLAYENQYGTIDAGACKYSIGSIERDNGSVEVYGIVYFYDKFGGVTDFGGDYSRNFTIHMTEWGADTAWCEF